jgi:hypothetical protein
MKNKMGLLGTSPSPYIQVANALHESYGVAYPRRAVLGMS